MQNTSEITGLRLGQRLEQLVQGGSYPVLCLGYGLGGLVAALARIVGGGAPFGVAFLAAVPFRFTLPATLGAGLGYLLAGGIEGGYRYLAACFVVTLLRWLMRPQRWDKHRDWLAPAVASAAVLAAGVLPAFYGDPLLYDLILWGIQVVIAGAGAFFCQRGLDCLEKGAAGAVQEASLWVLFSVGIMGLCTLELGGVAVGRIAAATAVLFAARVGGIVPATMTGVVCGFATGFAAGDFSTLVTVYALGGLLAGVFSIFGRVGSAIAFTAAYGMVGMLAGGSGAEFAEVAIAGVLFLMLPAPWFKLFAAAVGTGSPAVFKSLVSEQVSQISLALRDLSATTGQVARRLGQLYTGDISGVYDQAAAQVCRSCPYQTNCWQQHHSETVDALAHGLRQRMQGNPLTADDFPAAFGHCIHKKEMAQYLSTAFDRYAQRDEEQRRATRMRKFMADQMEGIALALEDLNRQMDNIYACDSVLAAKAETLLEELRLEPQRVVCWRDGEGHLRLLVELPTYKESRCAPELLVTQLGELLEIPLNFPVVTRKEHTSRLVFNQRPRYSLEYGSCQLCCTGHQVCGDSFRILNPTGTRASLLLSDGMGSGNSAAVDSAMASSLTARLAEAGLSFPTTLKLVNGALLVKSGEESIATMDVATIDLYSGRVHLYKAGAAPTVVCKNGRGLEIDATSLPAGIMEGVEFVESRLTLEQGDLLMLLSDGAVPDCSDWIARTVEAAGPEADLDQLCQKIANSARLRCADQRDDDITVLCCRVAPAAR